MDNHSLHYVGDGKPTRLNNTIDLVFTTSDILAKSKIVDDDRHSTGSDHEMVQTWVYIKNMELKTLSKRKGRTINQLLLEITQASTTDNPHPAETAWIAAEKQLPREFLTAEDLEKGATQLV